MSKKKATTSATTVTGRPLTAPIKRPAKAAGRGRVAAGHSAMFAFPKRPIRLLLDANVFSSMLTTFASELILTSTAAPISRELISFLATSATVKSSEQLLNLAFDHVKYVAADANLPPSFPFYYEGSVNFAFQPEHLQTPSGQYVWYPLPYVLQVDKGHNIKDLAKELTALLFPAGTLSDRITRVLRQKTTCPVGILGSLYRDCTAFMCCGQGTRLAVFVGIHEGFYQRFVDDISIYNSTDLMRM